MVQGAKKCLTILNWTNIVFIIEIARFDQRREKWMINKNLKLVEFDYKLSVETWIEMDKFLYTEVLV